MRRAAARAGHDDLRRPAPQPRGQLGERRRPARRPGARPRRAPRAARSPSAHHAAIGRHLRGSTCPFAAMNRPAVGFSYRQNRRHGRHAFTGATMHGLDGNRTRQPPLFRTSTSGSRPTSSTRCIEGQFAAVAAVRAARPAIERAALAIEERLQRRRAPGLCRRRHLGPARGAGRRRADADLQLAARPPGAADGRRRRRAAAAPSKAPRTRPSDGAAPASASIGSATSDVLIAVAASGTTPFTLACLREAARAAR